METVIYRHEGPFGTYELPLGDHQTNVWMDGGHYEKAYVEMLLRHLIPGSVAVDAGACFGAHAIPYALAGATVYAFEPNPEARVILENNIRLSGVGDRIAVRPEGLSDEAGLMCIPPPGPAGNMGGLRLRESTEARDDWQSVKVVPLDSLELGKVDVLKIDVEGMTLQVLRGGVETIRRCRPVIFTEMDGTDEGQGLIFQMLVGDLDYRRIFRHGKNVSAHP